MFRDSLVLIVVELLVVLVVVVVVAAVAVVMAVVVGAAAAAAVAAIPSQFKRISKIESNMYGFCINRCYQSVACTSTEMYILHSTNFDHVRRNCYIQTLRFFNRSLCILLVLLHMLYSSQLIDTYLKNCGVFRAENASTAAVYRQVSVLAFQLNITLRSHLRMEI
jgi:hypothetical protein